ncbi:hypothetical protein HYW17_00590 [Candidatus Uhrbacteria bacterium]|nr:hypothetical protein [Candidatus Uhrbacteria bacterium]
MEREQEILASQRAEGKSHDLEERNRLESQSRRQFLAKLRDGFLVLGLGTMEATLGTGCALQRQGMGFEDIQRKLERYQEKIADPNDYLRYLQTGEYVIKEEVFEAMVRTVDKRPEWLVQPIGGYQAEPFLASLSARREFSERLHELGVAEEKIVFYTGLFSTADTIVFRETALRDQDFLRALPHERFHREIKKLPNQEYKSMKQAAEEMMLRTTPDGLLFVREKIGGGWYAVAASTEWQEFYTYLAQGEFRDNAEDALMKDYPQVYKLYLDIKQKCAIREKDDVGVVEGV